MCTSRSYQLINSIFKYLSPVDELFWAMTQSMTDALLISVWRPRLTELGPSWWRSFIVSNGAPSILSNDGMLRGDFDWIGGMWPGGFGSRKRTRFADVDSCSGERGVEFFPVASSVIDGICKWLCSEADGLIGGSSIREYVETWALGILYFFRLKEKWSSWRKYFSSLL